MASWSRTPIVAGKPRITPRLDGRSGRSSLFRYTPKSELDFLNVAWAGAFWSPENLGRRMVARYDLVELLIGRVKKAGAITPSHSADNGPFRLANRHDAGRKCARRNLRPLLAQGRCRHLPSHHVQAPCADTGAFYRCLPHYNVGGRDDSEPDRFLDSTVSALALCGCKRVPLFQQQPVDDSPSITPFLPQARSGA